MSDDLKKEEEGVDEELFEQVSIKVDPRQSQVRIDKFLVDRLEQTSRNKIQNSIKAGSVLVNKKQIKSNYKIRPNDQISVLIPKSRYDNTIIPENIPLDIRYEDDSLLIIHKPPGMVVHPGIKNYTGTLVHALAYHFKNLPVLEGNRLDRPGLVHRIDKNTSGLMVIPKTEFAMTHLAKQFFDHSIERTYNALVWGEPDDLEGSVRFNIGRHPRSRLEMFAFPEGGEEGKRAVTHYKVLEGLYYVSLIECKLETGRTHQIRVHMRYKNHPVFNDSRYGGDRIVKGTVYSKYKQFVHNCFDILPRQGLHAKSIGFIHPETGKEMYFESELPEDMLGALDKWRKYLAGKKNV